MRFFFSAMLIAMLFSHGAWAAESCWSQAHSTAQTAWCSGSAASIAQAKTTQVIRHLKAKHQENKAFAPALDQVQKDWENAAKKQCDLLNKLQSEEARDSALNGCLARAEYEHLVFLDDLLQCDGLDFGITSQEMLQCASTAKDMLDADLDQYKVRLNRVLGPVRTGRNSNSC